MLLFFSLIAFAAVLLVYRIYRMENLSIIEVKRIIRGLLVSCPEEITVSKLRHDFKAQEGCDLPFFDFGFRDVTSFLRSIPDVCKVCHNDNGPYPIVRLVESDKSAHVSSLVMRQKTTTKRTRRRPVLQFHRKSSQGNTKYDLWSQPKKTFCGTQNYGVSENNVFRNSMKTLNYEETSTHRLAEFPETDPFSSCHNGFMPVDVPSLAQERNKENGDESHSYVPDVFGNEFTDLESFMHNILQETLSGKGMHLNEVTEYLKNTLLENGVVHPKNMEEILRKLPYIRIVDDYVYYSVLPADEEITFEDVSHHPGIENAVAKIDVAYQDDGVCDLGNLSAHTDMFIPTSSNEKIQRLERNLYSLMKDHSEGILGNELKEKYKMKFAAPLNLKIVCCDTVWELADRMPHIFNLILTENGEYKLLPLSHLSGQTTREPKPIVVESEKEPVVPVITIRNIQRFMQDYPNGLKSKDFEQKYMDSFMGGIELQQMGFSTMDEFLKYLEKIKVLKIEVTESDVWLLPSIVPRNLTFMYEDPLPSRELMKIEVDIDTLKQRFPPDVIGPDIHIEPVKMPSWIQMRSMVEILVQEVKNPHCFWITFRGEQYLNALESLMDDLQAFYCARSYSYKMPEDLIREGQDCVTQFVGEWHRARITRIVSTSEAEVCFYDYGTTKIVQKVNIHYLHTTHSTLPAQAIRADLAGIAPVEDQWTQEASKRFLQIISYKALIGIVKAVDRPNNAISLFLCDTSGDEDVYIHDILVTEGFAVESAIGFNENESTNDVTSEEILDDQSLQEETKPEVCSLETISSNSIPENLNPHSEDILENYDKRDGKRDAFYQLPDTLLNNVTKNHQNGSTATSLPNVDSMLLVPKISHKSALSVKPFAPPPGFSHVNKSATDVFVYDKIECQASSSHSVINQAKQMKEEQKVELLGINTNPVLETAKKIESQRISEITPKNFNVHGTPEKTNSDFGNNKSYLQSSYNYSSWAPVPSAYPFAPASPAFPTVPVNASPALPSLPFGTYPLAMPNPWEYCNLWYYEQCRQQAFVQGMLAHQQMAAAFPPLPPGIYQPNSYSCLNTQRVPQCHMNISEVHSSEPPRVEKTCLDVPSAECQANIICTATQTDLPSGFGGSDEDLKTTEVSNANVSPVDTASDASVLRNEGDTHLHENGSSLKSMTDEVALQVNNDTTSETNTSPNSTTEDEISCQENACDNHNSFFQKTVTRTSDSSESNLQTICVSNSSVNVIGKSHVEKSADTDMSVISLKEDIQNESHCFKQTLNYSKTSQVDSAANDNNFKVENHSKPEGGETNTKLNGDCSVQRIATSQVFCISKSEDNLLVVTSSEATNEENEVRSVEHNEEGIPSLGSSNIYDQEFGDVENEAQEFSQVAHVNSLNVKEISLDEGNTHKQESNKNAQQECVINKPNLNIKGNSITFQLPQHVPEKLTSQESIGLTKVGQMNELTSKLIHSSSMKHTDLSQLNEHHKKGIEGRNLNELADKREESPDRSLKCSKQWSAQKSKENSKISLRHEENVLKPSTSGALLPEFGELCISNEMSVMNTRVPNVQNSFPPESLEKTVGTVPEMKISFSKTKRKPELGKKLSSEASSSIIRGSTQLAMTQKTCPTTPVMQATSATHGLLQTENSSSCDLKPSAQTWKPTWATEKLNIPSVRNQIYCEPSKNVGPRNNNVCKETAPNWHKESLSSSKQMRNYQFVKKIKLSGKTIYLINLDGRPYVLTDEIVEYFTPFNGRHVILKILEARKVEINFLEMSRRTRPDFFECLDKYEIKWISRGPTGSLIGSVHMVPLRSVPYMLRALNKDDATLSMEVREEMEKFDASDSYWFVQCE